MLRQAAAPLLAVLYCADPGFGQSSVVITGGAACGTCSIALQPAAVIGRTDGPGALANANPLISRDERGRFYVFGGAISGTIDVYDPKGTYQRTLGRTGSGPGEYRNVSGIVDVGGDSILVVDAGLGRMTLLRPDYALERTMNVGISAGRPTLVSRPQRRVVVNTADAGRGNALHVFDPGNGRILRSFANADASRPRGLPEGTMRNATSGQGNAVWSSYMTDYVLEQWTMDGSLRMVVRRSAPWFPATRKPDALQRGEPQPVIRGIDEDSSGRLWILVSVPDPRWQDAVRVVPNKRFPEVTDPVRHVDTVLEVLDPGTRRILVSRRFDEPMLTLLPGQFLVQAVPDAAGRPTLRISKLEVRER